MLAEVQKAIVDRILGSPDKRSGEFLYFCPRCEHHKNKLSISYTKNKFKCWVCEYSGSDIKFFIKAYGTYEDLKQCEAYSEHASLDTVKALLFSDVVESAKNKSCNLPNEYKFIYYSRSQLAQEALDYLLNVRKITEQDIYKWKIGICETGNLRGRFIIPSFNDKGYCNYYIAQGFLPDTKYKWLYPPDIMKYNIIFNELEIDWDKPVYLTEGGFDAIHLATNVIPLLGKTIPKKDGIYSKLIEKLVVYKPKVYVCLDIDIVNGQKINRSLNVAKDLLRYNIEDVEIIEPKGKDFGELNKEEIQDCANHAYRVSSMMDLVEHELYLIGF